MGVTHVVNTSHLKTVLAFILLVSACWICVAADTTSASDSSSNDETSSQSKYLISTPQIMDPQCPLDHIQTEGENIQVRTAVITVADPLESRLGRAFDSQIAAIIRAFHTQNYVLDGFALTWRLNRARDVPLDLQLGTGTYNDQHRVRPSILLFRKDNWRKQTRSDSRPGAEYFAAFLVGESPTFGVHPAAFKAAVLRAAQLIGALDTAVPSQNCKNDMNGFKHPVEVLNIIGPSFSGSMESLVLALGSVFRKAAATAEREQLKSAIVITSPSATVSSNRNMAWWTKKIAGLDLDIRYSSLAFTLESQLVALADYRGEKTDEKLVILAEESTFGHGVSEFVSSLVCGEKDYSCHLLKDAKVINFPQNIAAVRAEHSRIDQEKNADLRKTFKAQTRVLELDLSNLEEITDRPPAYRRELSSRSDELMLYGTFDAMRVWVKPTIVAVVATDIRDRLFLLNEVRKSLPNALPVLMEMDYLTAHPDFRKISRGALSIPNGETLLCMTTKGQLTGCGPSKMAKASGDSEPTGSTSQSELTKDPGTKAYLAFPSDYSANMFRTVLQVIHDPTDVHKPESKDYPTAIPKIWVSTLAGFQMVGPKARSKLLVADGRLLLERPVPIFFLFVGMLIVAIGGWLRCHGCTQLIMLPPLRHLHPFPGVREVDFQPISMSHDSLTQTKTFEERLNNCLAIVLCLLGLGVFVLATLRLLWLSNFLDLFSNYNWPLAHGRDGAMLACLVLTFIGIAVVAAWRMYLWQRRSGPIFDSLKSHFAIASVPATGQQYRKVAPGFVAGGVVLLLLASLFSGWPASVDSMAPAFVTNITLIVASIWFLSKLLSESNRLAHFAQLLSPTLDWPAKQQTEFPVRPANLDPTDSWASPLKLRALPQTPFSLRFRKRDLAALFEYPDEEWKRHTDELVKGIWPFSSQQLSFEDWQTRLVAEMRYALAAIRCCAWAAILAPTVMLISTGVYPPFNERMVTTSAVLLILAAFAVMIYVIIKFEQSPLLGRMFTLNGDKLSISGAVGALWGKVIAAAIILIPVLFPDVLSFIYRIFQSIDSLQ